MISLALRFVEYVLRGYGQLFLCNNGVSGLVFFAGLTIASPRHGLLSLLGAAIVTGLGLCLAPSASTLKSGLFGVNGVLLGYVWIFFPEVGFPAQAVATVGGAVLASFLLILGLEACRRWKRPFTLFTIPYVVATWISLLVLAFRGDYDLRMFAGWSSLAANQPERARADFTASQVSTPHARAYRCDGLAWAAFRQSDFIGAREWFEQAAAHDATFADPHDGLGWCAYYMGDYQGAESEFHEAHARDPRLADSWIGLGLLAEFHGDAEAARIWFTDAAWSAPMSSEAYASLQRHYAATSQNELADFYHRLATFSKDSIAGRYQYVSLPQLVCWLLFFAGVIWHSRISALLVLAALATCFCGARLVPSLNATFADIHFVYNLIAIFIACGGLYLRLNRITGVWLFAVTMLMAIVWHVLSGIVPGIGLPLLCLPLNLALAGTVALGGRLKDRFPANQAIPLELAVTSPEQVRLWLKKCKIADRCWQRMATFYHEAAK